MKNLEDLEEFLYWVVMAATVVFVAKVVLDMAQ